MSSCPRGIGQARVGHQRPAPRRRAGLRFRPYRPRIRTGKYAPSEPAAPRTISPSGQNRPVDLARIAWIVTVLACLIAVLILLLQAYYGYALVTFAVAVSAAFNLT